MQQAWEKLIAFADSQDVPTKQRVDAYKCCLDNFPSGASWATYELQDKISQNLFKLAASANTPSRYQIRAYQLLFSKDRSVFYKIKDSNAIKRVKTNDESSLIEDKKVYKREVRAGLSSEERMLERVGRGTSNTTTAILALVGLAVGAWFSSSMFSGVRRQPGMLEKNILDSTFHMRRLLGMPPKEKPLTMSEKIGGTAFTDVFSTFIGGLVGSLPDAKYGPTIKAMAMYLVKKVQTISLFKERHDKARILDTEKIANLSSTHSSQSLRMP